MTTMYLWLLAGVVFLGVEALGIPGVGMLFAGLGAIITGAAIYLHIIAEDATLTQFTVFFIATAVSAAVLWKPLQKRKTRGGYSNMVGDTAYVGSAGLDSKGGEVTWSGTIMRAQIARGVQAERLEAGSQVTIVEISGNILIVKPKA